MLSQREYVDRSNQFIHPFTAFLVSGLSELRNLINSGSRGQMQAVWNLEDYIIFLDPDIKKNLQPQIDQIQKMMKDGTLATRTNL